MTDQKDSTLAESGARTVHWERLADAKGSNLELRLGHSIALSKAQPTRTPTTVNPWQTASGTKRADSNSSTTNGAMTAEESVTNKEVTTEDEIAEIARRRYHLRAAKANQDLPSMQRYTQELLASCERVESEHRSMKDPAFGDFSMLHEGSSESIRFTQDPHTCDSVRPISHRLSLALSMTPSTDEHHKRCTHFANAYIQARQRLLNARSGRQDTEQAWAEELSKLYYDCYTVSRRISIFDPKGHSQDLSQLLRITPSANTDSTVVVINGTAPTVYETDPTVDEVD